MKLKGKRRTGLFVLIVIIVLAAFWLWSKLNAPVVQYQTLIVKPGELQQMVLATGKLDALRKVDVGAQVNGELQSLTVNIGDKVKKDQLLGIIDPAQAENQIKEVEATLMELRAQRQKHQRRMLDTQQQRDPFRRVKGIGTAKPRREPNTVEQNAAGAKQL